MSEHYPPRHLDCGRLHWPGTCPMNWDALKERIWERFLIIAGWVRFWRN